MFGKLCAQSRGVQPDGAEELMSVCSGWCWLVSAGWRCSVLVGVAALGRRQVCQE